MTFLRGRNGLGMWRIGIVGLASILIEDLWYTILFLWYFELVSIGGDL